jgi:hypothetical protein
MGVMHTIAAVGDVSAPSGFPATYQTAFDEATAVTPAGAGRYRAVPDERFAIFRPDGQGAVNGGVLVATVLRAVLDTSPHPYPVATSTHFLRVPLLEPADVEVTWLRQGRTASTARATVIQHQRPVLEVTVTTGDLPPASSGDPASAGDGDLAWTGEMPPFPPIEECVGLGPWPTAASGQELTGYPAQIDLRLDPATAGWRHGQTTSVPEMRGYFRLREDRDPDAYLLALAVDSLPPVVFALGARGWSPTVELSWQMRAVPAPGPLRVATRCRHVSGGWFDEEAEVWDAAGCLVAQSRQLARLGRSSRRADG